MPFNTSTGSTHDMCLLLSFHFYVPVLFNTEGTYFPSDSPEEIGRFVRISENAGHDMTFKILNSSTNKIFTRSNVRPAKDDKSPNLRADPITSPKVIVSLRDGNFKVEDLASTTTAEDSLSTSSSLRPIPIVDPLDLVGRTFLLNKEGGQCLRSRIFKSIDEFEVI